MCTQSSKRRWPSQTEKKNNDVIIVTNMAATRATWRLVSCCCRRRRRCCRFISYLVADRIEIVEARHCACVPEQPSITWFWWSRPVVNCVHSFGGDRFSTYYDSCPIVRTRVRRAQATYAYAVPTRTCRLLALAAIWILIVIKTPPSGVCHFPIHVSSVVVEEVKSHERENEF